MCQHVEQWPGNSQTSLPPREPRGHSRWKSAHAGTRLRAWLNVVMDVLFIFADSVGSSYGETFWQNHDRETHDLWTLCWAPGMGERCWLGRACKYITHSNTGTDRHPWWMLTQAMGTVGQCFSPGKEELTGSFQRRDTQDPRGCSEGAMQTCSKADFGVSLQITWNTSLLQTQSKK